MLDSWQLSSPLPPSSPLGPHQVMLVGKPCATSFGSGGKLNLLSQALVKTPHYQKSYSNATPALSSHFQNCLGSCPPLHREPRFGRNKPLHTLFMLVWHHWSQPQGQIRGERLTLPTRLGPPQEKSYLSQDLNKVREWGVSKGGGSP